MVGTWIKVHRKILEWEWYKDNNTKSLFIHLLIRANHSPQKWQGIMVGTGQILTGRKQLSKETGISEQSIRTSLNRLKSTNELTIESTSKYSIITLNNYNIYNNNNYDNNQQINQQANQQLTSNQPATNQQLTTNKNVKNDKHVKHKENIEGVFNFWNSLEIIQHRDIKKSEGAIKTKLENYTLDEIKESMQNYRDVLVGDKYFWEYKWELKEFLNRGIDKFLTQNKPFENFLSKNNNGYRQETKTGTRTEHVEKTGKYGEPDRVVNAGEEW